jgi:hypothetical protein
VEQVVVDKVELTQVLQVMLEQQTLEVVEVQEVRPQLQEDQVSLF